VATLLNCPVSRGIAVQFPLESLSKCRGIRSFWWGRGFELLRQRLVAVRQGRLARKMLLPLRGPLP
jgi:hypothetical protein